MEMRIKISHDGDGQALATDDYYSRHGYVISKNKFLVSRCFILVCMTAGKRALCNNT